MKISLSKGRSETVVDAKDFKWLSQWKWHLLPNGYAYRSKKVKGKTLACYMHREIMNSPVGKDIDHIDGNRLNNRRNNLRVCSRSQNFMNRRKKENTSSQYKGVTFDKKKGKWQAGIKLKGKFYYLGRYEKEIDAAIAYNKKATEMFGDFSRLNKV